MKKIILAILFILVGCKEVERIRIYKSSNRGNKKEIAQSIQNAMSSIETCICVIETDAYFDFDCVKKKIKKRKLW